MPSTSLEESETLGIKAQLLDQKYVERALGLRSADLSDEERLGDYELGLRIINSGD